MIAINLKGERVILIVTDICDLGCLKNKNDLQAAFGDKLADLKAGKLVQITLGHFGDYTLQYAPVGNYTKDPYVIICGKTTSGDSHDQFVAELQEGNSLHEACFRSIYSNMRENLFRYLLRIRLFEFLRISGVEYWNEENNEEQLWNNIFTDLDSSLQSGIQLTQACNCALLNNNHAMRSSEPPTKIFREANGAECFFKQFNLSSNLRLIIFLDTPSESGFRFHQTDSFDRSLLKDYPRVRTISITHPSNQNASVYNYLDDLTQMQDTRKRPNAIKFFENAARTVEELINEAK